ncbi:hypothetical protein OH77DRAFT_931690 [Trametes cingulata]|nr:hypothetical protein OH77DRAFT_931690 [Trametes cingulata]
MIASCQLILTTNSLCSPASAGSLFLRLDPPLISPRTRSLLALLLSACRRLSPDRAFRTAPHLLPLPPPSLLPSPIFLLSRFIPSPLRLPSVLRGLVRPPVTHPPASIASLFTVLRTQRAPTVNCGHSLRRSYPLQALLPAVPLSRRLLFHTVSLPAHHLAATSATPGVSRHKRPCRIFFCSSLTSAPAHPSRYLQRVALRPPGHDTNSHDITCARIWPSPTHARPASPPPLSRTHPEPSIRHPSPKLNPPPTPTQMAPISPPASSSPVTLLEPSRPVPRGYS